MRLEFCTCALKERVVEIFLTRCESGALITIITYEMVVNCNVDSVRRKDISRFLHMLWGGEFKLFFPFFSDRIGENRNSNLRVSIYFWILISLITNGYLISLRVFVLKPAIWFPPKKSLSNKNLNMSPPGKVLSPIFEDIFVQTQFMSFMNKYCWRVLVISRCFIFGV